MKRISLLMLWSFSFMALSNVSFHGYLVQPPNCSISNGQNIELTFRDVNIDDINGSNYEQVVPYTITCDTAVRDPQMEMTLTWSGTQSDFDDSAVATDLNGLGIHLKQAGSDFKLHTPLVVNETSLPVLTAVPVKKSGVDLPESDFEAWATLQVDYQ
ncbi:fimbrial protein [Escherichia coli]|uniref:Fimbrial protein n=6 Tax=Enterobacteriaceae TaxID=543 RepID=A0A0H3JH88_ECO57|nr:fimbrial protein [Escherichia coli]EET3527022.1 fimbrial protein [Escherichia coli O157:NM]EFW7878218.1 fimbrial protein [Shigella sonnei]EFW8298514.1 fimbrial protein [Shigella flexneri]EHU76444.1 putative fimbrial-like adhesin exported protein [Escherichia coli DEC3E]EHV05378.1 putative fimbrial-like adhesin exported protein [Escherichia coli DEC4C]EHY1722548.1 fimbrial protein [Escherichia coli O8]EJY0132533.1 fimbrial protein [Escherichia coli O76]EJY0161721.1 fimbrial protein [Esche